MSNTDVNDFAWGGGTPTMSKIAYSEYTAASGGHGSAAPRAISKACNSTTCHDSTTNHDTSASLTGTNPFRLLDQSGTAGVQFSCAYTGVGCHVAGVSGPQTGKLLTSLVTHSNEAMTAAGYTPKRTWPTWDPQCVNCHDPHGDANLSMISKWGYDKAPFNIPAGASAAPYTGALPVENVAIIFTDSTTGAGAAGTSYADTDAAFSSLCQECHEAANIVAFKDGTSGAVAPHPGAGANPGDCTSCHGHEAGFKPAGDCNSCHGYPPTDATAHKGTVSVDHDLARADGGTFLMANHGGGCWYCHGTQDSGASTHSIMPTTTLAGDQVYVEGTHHDKGAIEMNGNSATLSASYNAANGGCDSAACHSNDASHRLVRGNTVALLRLGPGQCQTCHQAGAGGAPIVPFNVAGRHVNPTGNTAPTVEMCKACHSGHADGTADGNNYVEIDTRQAPGFTVAVPTMNEQYSSHAYAINLGGTATSAYNKSTEAQMCWSCHYDRTADLGSTMSEFGVNNNTNTGSMVYNYGSLSSWNATDKGGWYMTNGTTLASWTSGTVGFGYKTNLVGSMHGANYNATARGNDPVGQIRCSYCHDVHDTGTAPNRYPLYPRDVGREPVQGRRRADERAGLRERRGLGRGAARFDGADRVLGRLLDRREQRHAAVDLDVRDEREPVLHVSRGDDQHPEPVRGHDRGVAHGMGQRLQRARELRTRRDSGDGSRRDLQAQHLQPARRDLRRHAAVRRRAALQQPDRPGERRHLRLPGEPVVQLHADGGRLSDQVQLRPVERGRERRLLPGQLPQVHLLQVPHASRVAAPGAHAHQLSRHDAQHLGRQLPALRLRHGQPEPKPLQLDDRAELSQPRRCKHHRCEFQSRRWSRLEQCNPMVNAAYQEIGR